MKISLLIFCVPMLFIKMKLLPNVDLLAWLFIAILIDLLTGVLKAKLAKKEKITSLGFRSTTVKVLQYLGLIIGGTILVNTSPKESELVLWINNGLLLYMLHTEVYSIFENFHELNPNSRVAKVFRIVMTLLTLGLEKNTPQSVKDTAAKMIVFISVLTITSCRIIKPQTNDFYSKKDTTITNYKQVDYQYKGATVSAVVNVDSILIANFEKWKNSIPNIVVKNTNMDSLFSYFIAAQKGKATEKITVIDTASKAELKYWIDEYGKLNMSCTSKDQTLQFLVAENTRLTQELSKKSMVEIVYKMPFWGWLIAGWAMLTTFVIAIFAVYQYFKKQL